MSNNYVTLIMGLTIGINSWVTVAEADSYLTDKWGADNWSSLTNTQKLQALITAYYWIQSLADYNISATSTEANIKNAQIELAFYISENYAEHNKRRNLYSQGVRSFKISKWSEKLDKSKLPKIVEDLLTDELINTGGYIATIERKLNGY